MFQGGSEERWEALGEFKMKEVRTVQGDNENGRENRGRL